VNCQSDDQRGSDFAEMLSGISVEMTGRASRANVMKMFADEKEKRVAGNQRQQHSPPRARAKTLGQNRKDCYAEKRSGRETDERAKGLMLKTQRRANRSAGESEDIGGDDLPERVGHLGVC